MALVCARCHHRFSESDGAESNVCPSCGAEAGLEKVKATPAAMMRFAVVLGGAVLVAVVFSILSLGRGA